MTHEHVISTTKGGKIPSSSSLSLFLFILKYADDVDDVDDVDIDQCVDGCIIDYLCG
jgi:hypothetical protein